VASLGIVFFPVFARRAIAVVDPDWFRARRLEDLDVAVTAQVRSDALALGSRAALQAWSNELGLPERVNWGWLGPRAQPIEVAQRPARVYDADLQRLGRLAEHAATVHVAFDLDSTVPAGRALIGVESHDALHNIRQIITLVRPRAESLNREINALHEEALEAIRSGSPGAADEIADAYIRLLLAWPRAWQELGQRLEGGLLSARSFFGLGPLDEVSRHLWLQLEQAGGRGLREHILTITRILYNVSSEAVELEATDLVRAMNSTAISMLHAVKSNPHLEDLVAEEVWRYHVQIADFYILPRLTGETADTDGRRRFARMLTQHFDSIGEALLTFHEQDRETHFHELDRHFRLLMDLWDPRADHPLAEQIVADPDGFEAAPDDVQRAHQAVEVQEIREDLEVHRTAVRLSVLAVALDRSKEHGADAVWSRVGRYSESMPDVDGLTRAVDRVLEPDRLLSRWARRAVPEREVVAIDSEGPALQAFVYCLLVRASLPGSIRPSDWMSSHRVQRAISLADSLLEEPRVRDVALAVQQLQAGEIKERLQAALRVAEQGQRSIERQKLIDQSLDEAKVSDFRETVIGQWKQSRTIDALLEATNHTATDLPAGSEDIRLGFHRKLLPKGLFVTPTNWAGLASQASAYGRRLAQAEVSLVVKEVVARSKGVRARGGPADRARQLVQRVRQCGYEPSLVVIPIDWRLAQDLNLEKPSQSEDGLGSNLKGYLEGVPVIWWWDVPKDRIYAVDLRCFCTIAEAIDSCGEPEPPIVLVEAIDEEQATAIVDTWGPHGDEAESVERLNDVMTSVRVDISRPYTVSIEDNEAAGSAYLPGRISDEA
jgi:hypothetical protein